MIAFLFPLGSPLSTARRGPQGEKHKAPSAGWIRKWNASVGRVLSKFQGNLKQFPTPTPLWMPVEGRTLWTHDIKLQILPDHIDQSISMILLSNSPLCD